MDEVMLYEYNFAKPELSEELLMHYGVKGMHWGVRRYQNYDGTRIKGGKTVRSKSKMSKAAANRAQRRADKEAQKKRVQKTKEEIAYMNRHPEKYSTKEINEKLNRINAESRLSDMNRQLNPTLKDRVKKIANNKAVKAIAITALAAAVAAGTAAVITRYNKYGMSYKQFQKYGSNPIKLVDFSKNPDLRKPVAPPFSTMAKGTAEEFGRQFYKRGINKVYGRLGLRLPFNL